MYVFTHNNISTKKNNTILTKTSTLYPRFHFFMHKNTDFYHKPDNISTKTHMISYKIYRKH